MLIWAKASTPCRTAGPHQAACLVVDIQLGDISGVEMVRRLSATGFTFPIIFITFITGSQDELHRRQAMDVGCVAFLLKPFPADSLIEAIRRAISLKLD